MEIYLAAEAGAFIAQKSPDKAITLGVGKREGAHCGCSVGGGVFPTAKLGVSPFDVGSYDYVAIDGISIYYPPTVASTFRTVTVKVEGIFFYKQLLALAS